MSEETDPVLACYRTPNTTRAYTRALNDFAAFLGAASQVEAISLLFSSEPEVANARITQYRDELIRSGKSAATVNVRLAAIRAIVNDARGRGQIGWTLTVPSVANRPVRDTEATSSDVYQQMVSASAGGSPREKRDTAILRLIHDCGLRRMQIAGLDMSDLDWGAESVHVFWKTGEPKQRIKVPKAAWQALAEWSSVRGGEPGPLFVNVSRDPNVRGRRMSGTAINSCVVQRYGAAAGATVSPRTIRRQFLAQSLVVTDEPVELLQFIGHPNIDGLVCYDRKSVEESSGPGTARGSETGATDAGTRPNLPPAHRNLVNS